MKCWSRLAALAILLALCMPVTGARAQSGKPRVPPGLDPGGVAVAIAADTGIDYTLPHIARRLARDGEGELIGWDFVDEDRRPYSSQSPGEATSTGMAGIVLMEASSSRLVPFRTKREVIALGRLMVFTGKGPAKVLLLLTATDKREDWAAFAEAAAHFKHVLTIVPAAASASAPFPASLGLDTTLVVAESTNDGRPVEAASFPSSELATPAASGRLGAGDAAARIAALAARVLAVEPKLEGAALKARILSLAKPLPALYAAAPRHGWIAEPHKLFQAK